MVLHAQQDDAGVYHCVADIGQSELVSRDVPLGQSASTFNYVSMYT